MDSGVPPVRSFPDPSNITVAMTGRSEFSFAASTAAFSSYISLMVSMRMRSTPQRTPSFTTSA